MSCHLVAMVFALVTAALPFDFDVTATLRKMDSEKRVAVVFANGQERTVKIAADCKVLNEAGSDLNGGLTAAELKEGTIVTLTVSRDGNTPTIVAIRLGARPPAPGTQVSVGKPSVGFMPLNEMTAADRYKGEDGGLYGGGSNDLPQALEAAASTATKAIQPLNEAGKPAADGKIGLVSISMSNATQEFSRFKQLADADPKKSPHVQIIDCAQGGQTMARWSDPDAACWKEAERRLRSAGVARAQVQVAWVKLANAGPSGDLKEHGKQLEKDTRAVVAQLKAYFPNLRIAYLGSRIYGGYADGRLNPEPYAYEGAFVVRWLIQGQMNGDADLNFEEQKGTVSSPLLMWGPYFWADGTKARKSDGLVWERSDFANDGTHPSDSGRQKVAEQLLTFFKQDHFAQTWFTR